MDPRGQHLHLDCASGAAGDMMLGALIDLGVPIDVIGDALDAIGAGRWRLAVHRVVKGGIAAADVKVDASGHILPEHQHAPAAPPAPVAPAPAATPPPSIAKKRAQTEPGAKFVAIKFRAETHERHVHVDEHGDKIEEVHEHNGGSHGHAHGQHAHYHYADIRWQISRAPLTDGTRARALDIFDRLARAEAKLHGTTIDEVRFHEVGAIDSIVDVVGTAAALDWLRPASVSCASIAMGHGTVKTSHGLLPVPAPAALEVLREAGGFMVDGGLPRELCTPTGAAILAATVSSWQPSPPGRVIAVGWGAGDMDVPDRPNVLRAVVLAPGTAGAGETVWQVDANIDDMSPELAGPASDALFAAGALDVWWTPITMKKGRPALTLSALVEAERRDAVIATMLRETTTIGVRFAELHRTVLTRRMVEVETRYGRIPVKVAFDGDVVRNAAPEYEACAKAARVHGVPVKLVLAAALTAYSEK
jgi:pyridinium-3,5-bisthiocarboxylic acid mononucleotide nickel chelatase